MALQVWLPLNGDLKNKGCTDVTVTNNGATVDNNGKIGKCYKFNGSSNYITVNNQLLDSVKFSVCAWCKFNNVQNHTIVTCRSNIGYGIALFALGNGTFRFDTNDTNGQFVVGTWSTNKWFHIVITYDGFTKRVYVDGKQIGSKSSTLTSIQYLNNGWCIGASQSDSSIGGQSNFTNGYLNDVRIYDHCLSPKEVKEISQGLILHYKLDHLFTKNLIDFGLISDNYTIINFLNRTPGIIENNVYHVDGYQSETYIDTSFGILSKSFIILKPDSDYYLSFYCKSRSQGGLFFGTTGQAYTGLRDSSNNIYRPSTSFTLGTEYSGYVVLKIHTGSDTQYRIYLGFDGPNIWGIGSFMEFSQIVLSEVEPDFNACIENVVTDCSGYGNNGTYTNESDPILDSDTPRYNNCIKFDTTSKYVQTTNLPAIGDIYSISWWMYQPGGGVSKMPWGYSNGNHLNFYDRYCNTGDSSSNPYYIPGTTSTITSPPGNMWHHMVQVGDGSTVKLYMDGVLYGQAKTFKGITGTTLILNGWHTDTNYKLANAKLSDFRIYATALSAEDVRQLYQVGASIDNIGNVHSYEIDETSTTKTKLSKTGIFETEELIEGNDKAIIEKDVDMNINEFIET